MKLLILHSQPLVHLGFSALAADCADWEVLPWAASLEQGLGLLQEEQPGLVVVDDRFLGHEGENVLHRVRVLSPQSKVLALVTHPGYLPYWADQELSVDGVLSARAYPEETRMALTLVARGRRYLDPMLVQDWARPGSGQTRVQLTRREHQVLAALGQGFTNREIAALLVVSECTVKKHVSHILHKLKLGDRTRAALYACNHGLTWESDQ